MTRVKICGITRLEDALTAIEAGADALGFVFYDRSPRAISVEQAAKIISQLPPFVTTTGLFVNAAEADVAEVIGKAKIDLLQFHGDETPEFCSAFPRPYIKALRMRPELDLVQSVSYYPGARAVLLDAYRPGVPGGTGEVFDWARIPASIAPQIILAGGLSADNVAAAVTQVRPYAVDVSGGVEVTKGVKDAAKIRQFIDEVKRVG